MQEIKYKDHDEWLAIRRKYIGGSDAAAAIGVSPWKSPFSLWAEKTGAVQGFEGNLTTQVGAFLEEFVAGLFSAETGKKVRRKNAVLVNEGYPFACADVDRLVVGENALLEIKTTNSLPLMRKLRNGGDEFPDAYYPQVVHYMAVTGAETAYLAVLINCRELKIYTLHRDQAEIDALMDAEREFWTHVETNTPPEVDGSDATAEALDEMYPDGDGEITLFGLDGDLEQYQQIGDQIKVLKGLQTEAANRVKAALGTAARGSSDRFRVSWSSSQRKTFDAARFAAEHKDMDLSPYYKVSESRTFRVKDIS
jgi:putative phage-type endonuclease